MEIYICTHSKKEDYDINMVLIVAKSKENIESFINSFAERKQKTIPESWNIRKIGISDLKKEEIIYIAK